MLKVLPNQDSLSVDSAEIKKKLFLGFLFQFCLLNSVAICRCNYAYIIIGQLFMKEEYTMQFKNFEDKLNTS